MANHLAPARTLSVAVLLLDGATVREASDRSSVNREAVTRIKRALDVDAPVPLGPLPRSRRSLRSASGAPLEHSDLLRRLVRHAAIRLAHAPDDGGVSARWIARHAILFAAASTGTLN